MKYHNVTTFLAEAVAKVPLDLDTVTIPGGLKIIRFVDYVTTGIDEDFMHEGNNAGKGERAKSRENKRGNYSSHIDVCNSCVNSMLTRQGTRAFSDVTYEDILVPRIPKEFEGTDDDVDSEWDFIEKCPSIMNNMKGVIGLSGDINQSALFVNKNSVSSGTVFYRASLLYGYINNENALAVVSNNNTTQVDIKPRFLNLDPDMKYIDEEIEARRPEALALLKEIYSANPEDFPDVSDPKTNNGTAKSDIRELLNTYKSKIPADGNVFLSSDEIKALLPLLQYFKTPKESRESNDKFFDKLADGMSALEQKGVHFGDYSTRVSQIQAILNDGRYDIVLGYSQEGDKSNTDVFKNKGEEIFVGYVTNYNTQTNSEVIPVYLVNKNPSYIEKLKGMIGKTVHIGPVPGNPKVAYNKVNTDKSAKRTGGNELIFQLPQEIYSGMFDQSNKKEAEQSKIPAEAIPNKEAAKEKKVPSKKEAKPVVSADKKPAEPSNATAPSDAPAQEIKNEQGVSPIKRIFNDYGKKYSEGVLTRAKAIALIKESIKKETGRAISADSIATNLDNRFTPKTTAAQPDAGKSPDEIERGLAYNSLFGKEFRNTKLAPSAIPRIKKLSQLGHNYTNDELNNLVDRGIKRSDLDSALGKPVPAVMEARISNGVYSIKTLLENLNRSGNK